MSKIEVETDTQIDTGEQIDDDNVYTCPFIEMLKTLKENKEKLTDCQIESLEKTGLIEF